MCSEGDVWIDRTEPELARALANSDHGRQPRQHRRDADLLVEHKALHKAETVAGILNLGAVAVSSLML